MRNKFITSVKFYFSQAISVINSPKEFFTKTDKELSLKPALRYLVFLWITSSVISLLLAIFIGFILPTFDKSIPSAAISFTQAIPYLFIGLVISFVQGIVFTLVGGLFLHLWIKIFRGKGSLTKTLQLEIYSTTPTLLFGWLPIASIIATFYLLYLLFIGAQILHEMPKRRSLVIFIIIPLSLIIAATFAQFGAN